MKVNAAKSTWATWKADPTADAHLVVASHSGGIDSMAALIAAAAAAARHGVPLVVVHADMGSLEWPSRQDCEKERASEGIADPSIPARPGHSDLGSTALAIEHARMVGARMLIVSRPQGELLAMDIEKGTWARIGMGPCQGTSDHKRGPIWTAYTMLTKELLPTLAEGERVRICEVVGLAAHESGKRSKTLRTKYVACDLGGRVRYHWACSNKLKREVITWCPIANDSQTRIWSTVRAAASQGTCPHPSWVYTRMPRLSCTFCEFADRDAINVAAQLRPAHFRAYLDAERDHCGPWRDLDQGDPKDFTLAQVADDIAQGRLVDVATTWGDQA